MNVATGIVVGVIALAIVALLVSNQSAANAIGSVGTTLSNIIRKAANG